jgi:membrane fusion protein, heavy metal efflux system
MLILRKLRRADNLFFILLIAIPFWFSSCNDSDAKNIDERAPYIIPDSILKTIVIDSVREGELINSVNFTGQVDFNQDKQVNLFPLISGNIQDIKVQLGDYVRAGQTLAVIKSSEMAGYSNNLLIAETNLTAAQKQLEATRDLFHSGLASQLDVINAEVNDDQAKAQLEMSKRILKINGNSTKGEYEVKAPISGFIVQKLVTNAQAIRADNGNPLFTISDLRDVWIWANVYESNLTKVHTGDNVGISILSYPDRVFKGKVDKIMEILDPSTKVSKVRIVLNNAGYLLRPQMFATITVTNTQHKKALYIPNSALIFDHSQYYVLLYRGGGKADITPVEKLGVLDNKTYITTGVKEGDKIIASNSIDVYNQLNN